MNILLGGLTVVVGASLLLSCIGRALSEGNPYIFLFGILVLYVVFLGIKDGEVDLN